MVAYLEEPIKGTDDRSHMPILVIALYENHGLLCVGSDGEMFVRDPTSVHLDWRWNAKDGWIDVEGRLQQD